MSARFVHLHLHSEYSLADSTIRIAELVKRCVALGQPAVALTDIDNLFATVKFYKAAEAAGLKPIIGADIGLADGNESPSRMTLLCRDRTGYLTLSRLLSRAWMEGHRVDGVVVRPQWLREDNAGLFALAGRHSLAGRLASSQRHELAQAWLADWQGAFGDRLHLELTRTGRDGEEVFNTFALHASAQRGIAVVASNDARFLDRSEIIREKGTNRSLFFRGQVDKYTWVDLGSSYLPGELVAAFLWGQIEEIESITRRRMAIWNSYQEALTPLATAGFIRLPHVPDYCGHNAHMFYIVCGDLGARTKTIAHLKSQNINAVFHYVPLHSSPFGLTHGRSVGELPFTQVAADQLLRLPLWLGLEEQLPSVVRALQTLHERR